MTRGNNCDHLMETPSSILMNFSEWLNTVKSCTGLIFFWRSSVRPEQMTSAEISKWAWGKPKKCYIISEKFESKVLKTLLCGVGLIGAALAITMASDFTPHLSSSCFSQHGILKRSQHTCLEFATDSFIPD